MLVYSDWLLDTRSRMVNMTRRITAVIVLAVPLCLGSIGQNKSVESLVPDARYFEVTGNVHISRDSSKEKAAPQSMDGMGRSTVVWLEPIDRAANAAPPPGDYKMMQKDKEFHPKLLVVPVGSTVSFPNADPYFHNVFSLFNGRRFDLGLYESGQTRRVAFNREGVSYIFCNIHPEMSAVIISLKTPYYTMSDSKGAVTLQRVPEGLYRLGVWSELASPETLRLLSRVVKVDRDGKDLGKIEIHASSQGIDEHLNKFGLPYDTHSAVPPY